MDENTKSVTVLCSTYNSAKWIKGYLDSINGQMLKNFNIVFVDANSDDGSLQTIKDYKFREGIDVTVIENDQKISIYSAWNRAVELSNTDYVVNINTDDRLYPAGLLTYLNYALAYPDTDLFYCSYAQTDNIDHSMLSGYVFPPEHDHQRLLGACYGGPFPMVKRSSIIEDGMFDPSFTISGDYEMWLRMSKKGRVFTRVPECLGLYYNNPQGMSTRRDSEHWNEHVRQDIKLREMYR